MAKILVHMTGGSDDATVDALGFLVARTGLEQGHDVSVFLAGDAVTLLTDRKLQIVEGKGTGKLREHYDAIVAAGGRFYLSGMSSKARKIEDKHIAGKPAEFAMPDVLVRLAVEADTVFTY